MMMYPCMLMNTQRWKSSVRNDFSFSRSRSYRCGCIIDGRKFIRHTFEELRLRCFPGMHTIARCLLFFFLLSSISSREGGSNEASRDFAKILPNISDDLVVIFMPPPPPQRHHAGAASRGGLKTFLSTLFQQLDCITREPLQCYSHGKWSARETNCRGMHAGKGMTRGKKNRRSINYFHVYGARIGRTRFDSLWKEKVESIILSAWNWRQRFRCYVAWLWL